jgi:two-component system cell cycle response regulator
MSAKVLVVDDIEVNVRLLEAKLLSEYYDVMSASDGPRALEMARARSPDLILLDVMMPGMDGLEVCRRLKSDPATRYIPVVMVTALSDIADRLRGLEVGADDFLTKPVNDIVLFARVRSLIRLKRTLDEWLLREQINGQLASISAESLSLGLDQPESCRFLVLEDNNLAGNKLAQILAPETSYLRLVKTKQDALAALEADAYDIMILTLSLEQEDPLRLLAQIRAAESTRHMPVLLIVDEADYGRLAKGLDLGANDHIFRPVDRNELIARVRIQAKRMRLQQRLLDNYKRGVELALTDELTGLYNRRYLGAHLATLLTSAAAAGKDVSVLLFDVDHPIGDEVLIAIADRALNGVRGFDLVARYGGEEFVVVLPETGEAAAVTIAERLRRAVADELIKTSVSPAGIPVTISIGVSTSGVGMDTPMQLLKAADDALFAAKRGGRNLVMLWQASGPYAPVLREASA